jgi:type IV pilus assembly protein PilA
MLQKFASRKARRGFTLIELLVVVLILAILMAVALPLYLNAIADSSRKTCRANMQTIANAEQAFKVSDASRQYTTDLTKLKDLPAVPKCPDNGAYSVKINADGSITVSCNYNTSAHGTFTPGVDSN